ncbi:DUF4422 domain-containing protein [Pseudomonas sp. NPDC077408]
MNTAVSIMVAAHKNYEFPADLGYMPIQVGRETSKQQLAICGDNTGESISELNRSFCELTGLYWLWKNQKSSIYGLSHYRRYFKSINGEASVVLQHSVASSIELALLLKSHDVVVSKPRNYWVETVREHYKNAHHQDDLLTVESIIAEQCPDYLSAFNEVMSRRRVSLYNMFVMRSAEFNRYCGWLFAILFEAQKRIPYQSYGPYQGRVFGFLAERLLNVWIEQNVQKERVKYLPVVNLEGENIVKKAVGLLGRKFRGTKLD